jgi:hypothetical protein
MSLDSRALGLVREGVSDLAPLPASWNRYGRLSRSPGAIHTEFADMLAKATVVQVLDDPQWMIVALDRDGRELTARLSLKLYEAGAHIYPGKRAVVVLPRTDKGWATAIHVAPPGAELHVEDENAPSREDLIRSGYLRPASSK